MRHNLNIKALLFYTIIFFALSCNKQFDEQKNYPQDTTVSNPQGVPKDSMTFYFPSVIKKDSQFVKTNIDTFSLNWYSADLYCLKEPILYNYFQGHKVYRFLWLRSFDTPMVFSLNKDGNRVWLVVKKLDHEPRFMEERYPRWPVNVQKFIPFKITKDSDSIDTKKTVIYYTYNDSILKPNRRANIALNLTKNLSINEWNKFEQLLKECNYWTMTPFTKDMGIDGSEWVIEANFPAKYWAVDRWAPEGNYRKCGEYLIQLSGLQERIY